MTARLKEITVDPKTVVLAKKVDPAAVSVPKPSVDLKTGTSKYKADINAGGQTFSMAVTQTIAEQNGDIVATEVAATPMGDVSDTTTLQKGTLVLRKRSIKQGPVTIDLTFDDAKANGTMAMGGPAKPVSADLGGPLFGDGAGAYSVLATLPLAEGYTATFRNFDVQKQKASLKQLKVLGAEDVKVAGGDVQDVEGRNRVGRRRRRYDDHLGRAGYASTRAHDRDAASDGRSDADVGTATLTGAGRGVLGSAAPSRLPASRAHGARHAPRSLSRTHIVRTRCRTFRTAPSDRTFGPSHYPAAPPESVPRTGSSVRRARCRTHNGDCDRSSVLPTLFRRCLPRTSQRRRARPWRSGCRS